MVSLRLARAVGVDGVLVGAGRRPASPRRRAGLGPAASNRALGRGTFQSTCRVARGPRCAALVTALALAASCAGVLAVLSVVAPAEAQSVLPMPLRSGSSVEDLINGGDLRLAETELAGRLREQGETARNLLLRGVLRYRRERFEDALSDLRKSFSLDERDPATSRALGLCLVKLGQNDLAETFFEIATALAPADFFGHYYLGLNRYVTKRFDPAVEAFERALALGPESVEAHCYLGRSHEALGNDKKAGRLYRSGVRLNRQRPVRSGDPPLLLGTMLYRQRDLAGAETFLREALRHAPDLPRAHYWLGLLLEQQSDLTGAISALERAAVLDQSDHRPHYALARIHRRRGQTAKATESLGRFRELRKRSESEAY